MIKKIPMRQCIGCKNMMDKRDMMRIVHTPEGEFSVDLTGKKNGRGAYLCKKTECLDEAFRNKGLEKSFKMKIPQEISDSLKKEFESAK